MSEEVWMRPSKSSNHDKTTWLCRILSIMRLKRIGAIRYEPGTRKRWTPVLKIIV
jgi:hypothetical protein